jgi:L-glutamine-phosphate cytidylyltransferase
MDKGKNGEQGKVRTAVILAAGMGTRLKNVTGDMVPKGFLQLEGKSLIERSIEKLLKNSIEKIVIVTGHLNHFYDELAERHENIYTIKNENYKNTGSMASCAAAKELVDEDFLLLESDLIYEELALEELQKIELKDCVLLSGATYSGDEVFVEVRDNGIYNMSKNRQDLGSIEGELVGINKISKELYKRMVAEYEKNTNPQYHYEYAIVDAGRDYTVGYKKIEELIWSEIDDESHLNRVREQVLPRLRDKGVI